MNHGERKTSMIGSNLCDYNDACIHVKETAAMLNKHNTGAAANNSNKKVIFKNFAPLTNFMSEINNTEADDAQDIDVVIPIYNLIEYWNTCPNTSGSLRQCCRDKPALDINNSIIDFSDDDSNNNNNNNNNNNS